MQDQPPRTPGIDHVAIVHVVDAVPAYRDGIASHLRQQGFHVTTEAPEQRAHRELDRVLVAHTIRGEQDLAHVQALTG